MNKIPRIQDIRDRLSQFKDSCINKYDIDVNAWHTFSRVSFMVLFFLAMTLIAQLALVISLIPLSTLKPEWTTTGWYSLLTATLPTYGIALPVSLLAFRTIKSQKIEVQKMSLKELKKYMLFMFPVGFLFEGISSFLASVLTQGEATNIVSSAMFNSDIWVVLTVVLIAPIAEEYVFRKILIDRLHIYGTRNAVIFSSICFGLFHMNLYQLLYALATGLILGTVYVKTGKLRYSIIMHMFFNIFGTMIPVIITYFQGNIAIYLEYAYVAASVILIILGIKNGMSLIKKKEFIPASNIDTKHSVRSNILNIYLTPGFMAFAAISGTMIVYILIG